jgi:hypothetical protein
LISIIIIGFKLFKGFYIESHSYRALLSKNLIYIIDHPPGVVARVNPVHMSAYQEAVPKSIGIAFLI